jgi:hypothetical protein
MKAFIFVTAILACSLSYSANLKTILQTSRLGNEGGGGGDDLGLKFQASVVSALNNMKASDPETHAKIHAVAEAALKRAKFVVVDDTLDVGVKDLIQNSVAVNFPETGLIMINRTRWEAVKDSSVEEGISLHEVLSLEKLEQTGMYPYSAKYVVKQKASVQKFEKALAVDRLKQITAQKSAAVPYDILKAFYDEALTPAALSDFDDIQDNKLTCQVVSRFYIGGTSSGVEPSDSNVTQADVAKVLVVTKPGVEDRGPLLPGSPEVKENFLNINFQNTWFTKADFIGATLTQTSAGLLQYLPRLLDKENRIIIRLKMNFRKNNNMVTFYIAPNVGTDLKKDTHAETYGYCYR